MAGWGSAPLCVGAEAAKRRIPTRHANGIALPRQTRQPLLERAPVAAASHRATSNSAGLTGRFFGVYRRESCGD